MTTGACIVGISAFENLVERETRQLVAQRVEQRRRQLQIDAEERVLNPRSAVRDAVTITFGSEQCGVSEQPAAFPIVTCRKFDVTVLGRRWETIKLREVRTHVTVVGRERVEEICPF